MNNLMELLGLGGLLSDYSFPSMNTQEQMAAMQQYSMSNSICIHPNCPICKERDDNHVKLWQEQEELKKKKKEDYEKRCKEYMKKFRTRQEFPT